MIQLLGVAVGIAETTRAAAASGTVAAPRACLGSGTEVAPGARVRTNYEVAAALRGQAGAEVDLGGMTRIGLDVAAGIAFAEAGSTGGHVNEMLAAHGLAFTTGHCPRARIGEYVLQGGLGAGAQRWDFGAHALIGVDVVTATGDIVHASETEHRELFWSIRAHGGFAGIVTGYYLRPAKLAPAALTSRYALGLDRLDAVIAWLDDAQHALPDPAQISLTITGAGVAGDGRRLIVRGNAAADTVLDARRALAVLDRSPIAAAALWQRVAVGAQRELAQHCCDADAGPGEDSALHPTAGAPVAAAPWVLTAGQARLDELRARIASLPAESHLHLRWAPGPDPAARAEIPDHRSISEESTP